MAAQDCDDIERPCLHPACACSKSCDLLKRPHDDLERKLKMKLCRYGRNGSKNRASSTRKAAARLSEVISNIDQDTISSKADEAAQDPPESLPWCAATRVSACLYGISKFVHRLNYPIMRMKRVCKYRRARRVHEGDTCINALTTTSSSRATHQARL